MSEEKTKYETGAEVTYNDIFEEFLEKTGIDRAIVTHVELYKNTPNAILVWIGDKRDQIIFIKGES